MSDHVSPLPQGARELHVVFGSGGTQALLAGAGAVLTFHVGRLTDWTSIGGASAGSMPAAILARKLPPQEFLPRIIDTDFQALLERKTSFLGALYAMLRKYHLEKKRPAKGVFDPAGMRSFFDKLVPDWPNNFWTVASCDHGQVFFCTEGVFKYHHEGPYEAIHNVAGTRLADAPPSVGTAIHATCAIPGIIHSANLYGENLFDGALSSDGAVPVNMVWRHFVDNPDKLVLAIDVGEDPIKNWWVLRFLWNIFCGGDCGSIDSVRPEPRPGLVVVSPRIEDFHSLKFSLARGMKWKALLAGFHATTRAVLAHKLADDASAERLQMFAHEFRSMECKARNKPQELVAPVEAFLRQQGLLA